MNHTADALANIIENGYNPSCITNITESVSQHYLILIST